MTDLPRSDNPAPAPDGDRPAGRPHAEKPVVDDAGDGSGAARVATSDDGPTKGSPDVIADELDELDEPRSRGAIPRDRLTISIAAVVAALALLWLAGESHYRSCVDAVQVRNMGGGDALSRLARREDLESCSRLPV